MILAYEIIGAGAPLVFLHGLGADRRQTTGGLASMAKSNEVQLIAVDLRSHGYSIDNSGGECLNFDAFADDVITLMDYLRLDRIHLGGLSMGSGVALNIALRYPDRVESLILLRPSWLDSVCPPHLGIVAKVGRWVEEDGVVQAQQKLETDPSFLELQENEPTVAASILPLFTRPQAVKGASVLYRMFQSKPFGSLKDLQRIQHQALVMDTTHDDLHPQSVAKTIFDQLPNTENIYKTLPPRYLKKEAYHQALVEHLISFLRL